MTRDVAKAVPDQQAEPVTPDVLDSLLNTSVARGAGPVAVWRVPTESLADAELAVARDWLDEDERRQASSYVRAELRRAYEIAHAAARLVVGAVSDTPPEKVVWGRHACPGCGEPHGRPRAEGSGVEFSLSHTPGQVLVAVADVAVGVDVERHPDDPVALAKLLHPRELEEIEAAAHGTLDGGRATVRFTRAWARTEAYLKGIGIGLGRDPHLDYLGTDGAPSRSLGAWTVRDVVVPEGYGAALALLV
ncbi:4'-phosphopantetheinyl transferase superfamily protein [Nocardioides sp. SLBN-35]|uniref:4'-phosphopantetheinyl transferase family protein n=1 Tax=Nocardioides sp. SLBN-35 TaxID=2768445 RepID=UPI0011549881|nr:4'-phosphopantetheinyl transferase superfamily protein [Nocardioides sp. SLBN-35]TQK72920.1 4'-phosphopantetheinyl transferase [Nocardioides sp. SLBN-35]